MNYKSDLLKMWCLAEKRRSPVNHCYDGFEDGYALGLKKALEICGISEQEMDDYYNNRGG